MIDGSCISSSREILAEVVSLLPLKVKRAKWGVGSFITIDFIGQTSDICLWVYLCDWVLYKSGQLLMDSSGRNLGGGSGLELLSGRCLSGVEVDDQYNGVDLIFDDDVYLLLSPDLDEYSPEDDLVMIYLSSGRVAAFSCERGFYITR